MTRFLESLVNGLSVGSVYALIALGFVIVFKATEVVNFAHGSLLVLGGYVAARAHAHLPFVLALLCGAAASGLAALIVERLFVRKLQNGNLNALAILTIGVDVVLITELTRRFGADILDIGNPWGNHRVSLGSVSIPQARLAAIAVAAVLLRRSSWPLSSPASASPCVPPPRTARRRISWASGAGASRPRPGWSPGCSPPSPRSS